MCIIWNVLTLSPVALYMPLLSYFHLQSIRTKLLHSFRFALFECLLKYLFWWRKFLNNNNLTNNHPQKTKPRTITTKPKYQTSYKVCCMTWHDSCSWKHLYGKVHAEELTLSSLWHQNAFSEVLYKERMQSQQ